MKEKRNNVRLVQTRCLRGGMGEGERDPRRWWEWLGRETTSHAALATTE